MSSQPQTYSPSQYLDAGFRAEMSGDREKAAQYYHYIVEAFGDTVEGEAARGGLMRLGYGGRSQTPAGESGWDDGSGRQHNAQAGHASTGGSQRARPADHAATATAASHSESSSRIRLGEMSRREMPQRSAEGVTHHRVSEEHPGGSQLPVVVSHSDGELDEQLRSVSQFRGGRLLAHLLTGLGWLAFLGGLVLGVLGLAGVPLVALSGPIFGLHGGLVIGGASLVLGLALVLVGKMALANFEQAQSMREISILLRSRAER